MQSRSFIVPNTLRGIREARAAQRRAPFGQKSPAEGEVDGSALNTQISNPIHRGRQ